jgi:hypothetical protein
MVRDAKDELMPTKRRTTLSPERQLDKTLGLIVDYFDVRDIGYLVIGCVMRNVRLFCQHDFVSIRFSNGGGERWMATGFSSKGYPVRGHHMHAQAWLGTSRWNERLGRWDNWPPGTPDAAVKDIGLVKWSGQNVMVKQVLDAWTVDPTAQRAIVESLRAGIVARR